LAKEWEDQSRIDSMVGFRLLAIVVAEAAIGCLVLLGLLVLVAAAIHRTIWPRKPKTLGFFHPFCSSGGGGERVLWKMIESLERFEYDIIIYTVDTPSEDHVKGGSR
jgi:alpha-1,2-mannosyltransferase